MSQNTGSNNAQASSSSSTPRPPQQFTLEELIRVLQDHCIDVVAPVGATNDDIAEQHQIERSLQDQRAIETSADAPAPPDVPTAPADLSPSQATDEGSWTLFYVGNVPNAILMGGSSHLTSPIPTHLIDLIIAGLVQARDGPGANTDPKGKKVEYADNDYNLVPPTCTPDISGFVCAKCKAHNLVRSSAKTWYVVTVGHEVGVFTSWPTVQPLVIGVSGSCFKKYKSEAEAREAFALALAAGTVTVVP